MARVFDVDEVESKLAESDNGLSPAALLTRIEKDVGRTSPYSPDSPPVNATTENELDWPDRKTNLIVFEGAEIPVEERKFVYGKFL